MTNTSPPLDLRALKKAFGDVQALDGVDLTLGSDEVLALVGPSGCGKSTLLRAIAGLVAVDSGQIHLSGDLIDDGHTRLPPERRSTGLVFQEHALFPHLTVEENVAFGVRHMTRHETAARVEEMLDLVNLVDHGERYPHELSGGERQRVALARALAPRPALMLLDEPFASLDHNLRWMLRQQVVRALKATKTPAIFVTHDQDEALAIGDRIAVMRHGRIRQLDTAANVFHKPADDFIGAFMGEASFLSIDVGANGSTSALGPVDAVASSASVVAMVRPDDVSFRTTTDGDAAIVEREYHGSRWLVTVRLADGSDVLATLSHLEPPNVGDTGVVELVAGHRQIVVPVST